MGPQHPDQIKAFLQTVAAGQALQDWGIVDPDQGTLVSLFIDTVAATYSAETFAYAPCRSPAARAGWSDTPRGRRCIRPRAMHRAAVAGGGGLFSRRSVQEWLFDYTDPLLSLFQPPATPEQPAVTNAFRHSDVSEADARSYKKPWRMYTGLNNISQVRPRAHRCTFLASQLTGHLAGRVGRLADLGGGAMGRPRGGAVLERAGGRVWQRPGCTCAPYRTRERGVSGDLTHGGGVHMGGGCGECPGI